ncbi:MAG: MFS transporter [Rhodospirillaceae bacterium]
MVVFQVFLPFAFGYFLSYLFRNVNAVIAPNLIAELGLTAADLGLLTSANFFAFAAFQLPLGVLLDRYGPRKSEAALLLVAAAGAAVFGMAGDTPTLIIGRAMIGLGTSACLMAAFKAYSHWIPPARQPLITGFHMAIGGMGALTATKPIEIALGFTDWRGTFFILAGVTLAAAVILFTVVPNRDRAESNETLKQSLDGARCVFASPIFWRVAPSTVLVQSGYLGIQSLWSGPWLRDVAGVSQAQMATNLSYIAASMVVGFITMGAVTDRLATRGVKPMTVALTGMSSFTMMIVLIAFRVLPGDAIALWMIFGFLGTFGILPYNAVSQAFPKELTGRVVTGLNVMVFFGAFAAQWGIGEIIDLWPRPAPDHFAPEGYKVAFLTVAAIQAAGLAWYGIYRKAKI